MMNIRQFAALLGFLFVVVWIRFDFGDAVLCLVGACVFYLATQVLLGELTLPSIQSRLGAGLRQPPPPPPPPGGRVR